MLYRFELLHLVRDGLFRQDRCRRSPSASRPKKIRCMSSCIGFSSCLKESRVCSVTCARSCVVRCVGQPSEHGKLSQLSTPLRIRADLVERDASLAVPPSLPVLADVVVAYRELLGPSLLGVYLRGSAARGAFIPGVSDIDTFALYDESMCPCSRSDLEVHLEARLESVSHSGPWTKLETVLRPVSGPMATLLRSRRQLPADVPDSFRLATQSVTLWGLDLPVLLPPEARRLQPEGLADIEGALASMPGRDPAYRARLLRWCCKRLLRAAGEAAACEVRPPVCLSPSSSFSPRCLHLLLWVVGGRVFQGPGLVRRSSHPS